MPLSSDVTVCNVNLLMTVGKFQLFSNSTGRRCSIDELFKDGRQCVGRWQMDDPKVQVNVEIVKKEGKKNNR